MIDALATTADFRRSAARQRDDDRIKARQRLSAAVTAIDLPAPDPGLVATPAAPAARGRGRKAVPTPGEFLSPSWVPLSSPPNGNTGGSLESDPMARLSGAQIRSSEFSGHAIHLDWANWTFAVQPEKWVEAGAAAMPTLDAVRSLVSDYLGEQPEERLHGWHGYRLGVEWSDKGKLAWTPGRNEAWLSLNGDTLALIPAARQLEMFHAMWKLGVRRATRLDPAFDDFQRTATLDQIEEAVDKNNYSGTGRDAFERRNPKNPRTGELRGDSCIFGLRAAAGSGIMLRVYDKKLEMIAKGCPEEQALDCLRWEPEHTGAKATELWKLICACKTVKEYARCLSGAVTGCIKFVDRESVSESQRFNVSRMALLPWWERIVKILTQGPIIRVTRTIRTLCQSLQTLYKQWGGTMALARVTCNAIGVEFARVVERWCEQKEGDIDWTQAGKRDLSLTLPGLMVVAT